MIPISEKAAMILKADTKHDESMPIDMRMEPPIRQDTH